MSIVVLVYYKYIYLKNPEHQVKISKLTRCRHFRASDVTTRQQQQGPEGVGHVLHCSSVIGLNAS